MKSSILLLCLTLFSLAAFLNATQLLTELISTATLSTSQTAVRPSQNTLLTWSSLKAPDDPNQSFALIMRPTQNGTTLCAKDSQDKALLPSQIIVPSILLNGKKDVNFIMTKIYWRYFCFYLQKDLNVEAEILVVAQGGAVAVFSADFGLSFCDNCGTDVLSCDPLADQCHCPTGTVDAPYRTNSCISDASFKTSNMKSAVCEWANTNWPLSAASSNADKKCFCNNYWTGSACDTCSLSSCSLWTGSETCYTCATVDGTKQNPNSDCTGCTCTDPFYRGVTCACRSAIFDLIPPLSSGTQLTFGVPFPAAVGALHSSLSTEDSTTLTSKQVANSIYFQQLRLSLAIDLNVPISDIQVFEFKPDLIRFTISPWCATTFGNMWDKQTIDGTRTETSALASAFIITPPEVNDMIKSATQSTTITNLQYLTKLAQTTPSIPLGGPEFTPEINTFGILSNTDNNPFFDLQSRIKTNVIDNPNALVLNQAKQSALGPTSLAIMAKPIYFPGCSGDDRCADLSEDPYKTDEKSYTTIIIIVVVVGFVLVLIVLGVSIIYCNNKKICCFKAIHEANERRRRKEKEKADKASGSGSGTSGSGTNKSSHSTTDSESGSGSNSSARPGQGSATPSAMNHTFNNSSNSALTPEYNRSSGSHSGMAAPGQQRRPTQQPTRPSRGVSQSGGRRVSRSGSNSGVEMSSGPRPSRRESGTGRRLSRGMDNRTPTSPMGGAPREPADNTAKVPPPTTPGTTPLTDDEPALPEPWEKHTAQDGKTYYVNNETLTSTWVHPLLVQPGLEDSDSLDDLVEE